MVNATNAIYAAPPAECPWELRGVWKGTTGPGPTTAPATYPTTGPATQPTTLPAAMPTITSLDLIPMVLRWDDLLGGYFGTSGPRRVEYLYDSAGLIWSGQYRQDEYSAWSPLIVPVGQDGLVGQSLYDPVYGSQANFLVITDVSFGIGEEFEPTIQTMGGGFVTGTIFYFLFNVLGGFVRAPQGLEQI